MQPPVSSPLGAPESAGHTFITGWFSSYVLFAEKCSSWDLKGASGSLWNLIKSHRLFWFPLLCVLILFQTICLEGYVPTFVECFSWLGKFSHDFCILL